jgi:hypothetical protein
LAWFILAKLFSVLITLVGLGRLSETEKDLEILLLQQQISILTRNQDKLIHITKVEKFALAVLVARLKELTHRSTTHLGEFIRLFQPKTVIGWHRELVRRKMDICAQTERRKTTAQSRNRKSDPAICQREPPLGLWQNSRGAH